MSFPIFCLRFNLSCPSAPSLLKEDQETKHSGWCFSVYAVFKVRSRNGFPIRNGDEGIRTLDPLLARQVLSQLSYTPICSGSHLPSRTVSSAVLSAGQVLTVVFGMGTGVTPDRIAARFFSP